MRKRFGILITAILFVALLHATLRPFAPVHAQAITAASPGVTSTTGVFANCPAVALGTSQWCYTTTGIYQSLNGSPWLVLGVSNVQPAATLTINGVQKTLPAGFTITGTTGLTAQ